MTWEERLSDAGFRITASRRAVIQVLQEADAPLVPQDILERGGGLHPELGLTTVYRTVALLAELDLVRRVHWSDGCHAYVAASPGHRHHVVCRECGRSVEFPGSDEVAALIADVERATDYRIEEHLLQLFGICAACRGDE